LSGHKGGERRRTCNDKAQTTLPWGNEFLKKFQNAKTENVAGSICLKKKRKEKTRIKINMVRSPSTLLSRAPGRTPNKNLELT
jgi:hypothetical protein